MKKGSYVVQEVYESSSSGVKGGGGGAGGGGSGAATASRHAHFSDSSYSSCLLALLFFLALCIIIMLAAWPWNRGKKDGEPPPDEKDTKDRPVHEGLSGGENTTHSPHAGISEETNLPHTPHVTTEPPRHLSEHPTTTPKPTERTTFKPPPRTPHVTTEPPRHLSEHPTTTPKPTERTTFKPPQHPQEVDEAEDEHEDHPHHGGDDPEKEHHESTTPISRPEKENGSKGHTKGQKKPGNGTQTRTGGMEPSAEWIGGSTGRKKLEGYAEGPKETTPSEEVSSNLEGIDPLHLDAGERDGGEEHVEEEEKKPEVCQTPICKSLSARILSLMDHSANPCSDFYAYACGGMTAEGGSWISEEAAGYNSWSRISDMLNKIYEGSPISQQKFKSFYDSCVLYDQHVSYSDRIHKVNDILAGLGRFYREVEWKIKPGNLTHLIGNLLKHHFSPLFDILLDVDAKENKFAIKLTIPVNKSPLGDSDGVALTGWSSEPCRRIAEEKPENNITANFNERYNNYTNCSKNYEEYLQGVRQAIKAVKVIKYENKTITSKLITESTFYLDILLTEVIHKMSSPGKRRQILLAKEFHTYTIKELIKKYPMIDWQVLISMLLERDVTEETEIQVYFEDYFKVLFDNLSGDILDERTVYNALMAMFAHELYHGLVVTRNSCNRKAYCLNVATQLMDAIASSLFLRSYNSEHLSTFQSKITLIFNELLTTLKVEISTLKWIDRNSQILALDKLTNLKLFADGGVSVYLNESFLDAQYIKEAVNETYLENAVALMKRYRERMYQSYQKNPLDPEQIWSHFLLPYREQGIVIYGLNSIVIPYGLMFKPFFSEDYPSFIQMSGLGFMIAHEIWHQFDTTGIKYDPKGRQDNKFTEDMMAVINSTAKCTAEQSAIEHHDVTPEGKKYSYKLDPSLTLNERLVDIGGAHLAFKTEWRTSSPGATAETLPWSSFTPQQLYFLSLAQSFCTKSSAFNYAVSIFEDEHLPSFKRVNDIAFNSREFNDAFSCHGKDKHRCEPFTLH